MINLTKEQIIEAIKLLPIKFTGTFEKADEWMTNNPKEAPFLITRGINREKQVH